MKKENKYIAGIIILIILVLIALLILYIFNSGSNNSRITNFEECVKAGNPVMEIYPRQCKTNGMTFTEELQENNLPELFRKKAIEKLGVIPVEGFDPELYKGAFKGLIDNDFNNAKAISGIWKIINNKLSFVRNESEGITSADGTLTDEGILTLINNLETRLNIKVNTKEDIDNLIMLISKEQGKLKANYCSNESRNAYACPSIYGPVCGWSDPAKIQCIKYPCAQEYDNSCNACKNKDILYWTDGECPKD